MSFQELAVLLPCHSLEDFPQHLTGDEADGMLAAWTALWHPLLLAPLNKGPQWYRADEPPDNLENHLVLIPAASSELVPEEFMSRTGNGSMVIRNGPLREEIVRQALEGVERPAHLDAEMVADFFALGFGYLQIQLLTRQMRYSSNLDEGHFFEQLLTAARAVADNDPITANNKLTVCFDLLSEERDHYYSVDAYLIDLTMVAKTTIGASLRRELQTPAPINLLIGGQVLDQIGESEIETLKAIQERDAPLGIVGGEWEELPLPVLPCETILENLRRGKSIYQKVLGRDVEVFGRWRAGLTPLLPGLLERLGFQGALHFTLEEGRFPQAAQSKTSWEGWDGASLDSLSKAPLDASLPETFLSFASRLGEAMDMDHVATICLAHWPDQASVWYEDLRRCAKYGAALGKFVSVEEYFRETYMPGHMDRFETDKYQTAFLRQAIIRKTDDFLSSHIRLWQQESRRNLASALREMTSCVTGTSVTPDDESADLTDLTREFAESLPRSEGTAVQGYLAVNPSAAAIRQAINVSKLDRLPDIERPVYAADTKGDQKWAVVDVPAMGYAWIPAGGHAAAKSSGKGRRKSAPLLAEDLRQQFGTFVLRNEFLEATVNASTGSIQSLKDYNSRDNRLSQQLSLRQPGPPRRAGSSWEGPNSSGIYSTMVADEVRIECCNQVHGEIVAHGRLLDATEETVATFAQTMRVTRGSRILELEITIEPVVEPSADPWNTYYACRFAWNDELAELYRSVQQTRQKTEARRIEAPQYVDVDCGERRTTILTGGLPYHRFDGLRMLDTMLIIRGESARQFKLGIAVDSRQPWHDSMRLLEPSPYVAQVATPPRSASTGWLFHFESKHLAVTEWAPMTAKNRIVGARLHLLETAGRSLRTRLRCFRDVISARRTDFRGESLGECPFEQDHVRLDMAPNEFSALEIRWEEE